MSIEISSEKRAIYLQKRINELESILSASDVDLSRVGTVLHQLQGSSSTFGFDELVDHVSVVQEELRQSERSPKIRALLKDLVSQLDTSKRSIKESIYL